MEPRSNGVTIWRFLDGKPGHENQSLGLVRALAARIPCVIYEIPPPVSRWRAWMTGITGLGAPQGGWPTQRPDLIIGAGHGTHPGMLAARRRFGGRIVLLMRPSQPLHWFDLCLIPQHDDPPALPTVWPTQGVLNAIQPHNAKDPHRGIMLIGGPSVRHGWDEQALCAQILTVTHRHSGIQWHLTDSRRTPATFLIHLEAAGRPDNLTLIPWQHTNRDWVPTHLNQAATAWVSEDSVSMVYEALTAQCAVGILDMPRQCHDRVIQGVETLAQQRLVIPFAIWHTEGQSLIPPDRPFHEAARAAQEIHTRWFSDVR
jgi:hypothetical protein